MSPTPTREKKVLALGLPRSGTASMAAALRVLGYNDVYHGLDTIDNPDDWVVLGRAADAFFPTLPTYTGEPFTRANWDEVFGSCEAMTDVAAPFAPELIQAYPEAKVVLVIREYDKWQRSFDAGVLANAFGPVSDFAINFLEAIAGTVTGASSRKVILGYWRARNVHEIRTNMRETYDRHHTQIRKLVPPERLLEYRLGEGWESLCEFLDKPVPNQQFPHVNEAAELQRRIREKITRQVAEAARNLLPWALAIAVAGVAFWKLYRKTDIL